MPIDSVTAPSDPVHGFRDGEPLELAIADAERKAHLSREQANTSIALAEKWEGVATQLREARELARQPAGARKPDDVVSAYARQLAKPRKAHGYWWEQVTATVRAYLKKNGHGPSKNMVIRLVMQAHPGTAKTSIYHVVNKAIDDGNLKFRGPDCLYMPEDDPGPGSTCSPVSSINSVPDSL